MGLTSKRESLACALPPARLARYVATQIARQMPDGQRGLAAQVARLLPVTLERFEHCLAGCRNSYFRREGRLFFDPLHSDQYAMFLYLLAHESGRGGEAGRRLATKCFLLNKALHALDVWFEVELPSVFLFAHPVGTVLGRAEYGEGFLVMQNCTVGNVAGRYPRLGRHVILCAGASVMGDCRLGDEVCVGAGSLLINAEIPCGRTVVGRSPDHRMLPKPAELWRNYFAT